MTALVIWVVLIVTTYFIWNSMPKYGLLDVAIAFVMSLMLWVVILCSLYATIVIFLKFP